VQALVALTHHFGAAMAARGKGGIINVCLNASFQLSLTWQPMLPTRLSSYFSEPSAMNSWKRVQGNGDLPRPNGD